MAGRQASGRSRVDGREAAAADCIIIRERLRFRPNRRGIFLISLQPNCTRGNDHAGPLGTRAYRSYESLIRRWAIISLPTASGRPTLQRPATEAKVEDAPGSSSINRGRHRWSATPRTGEFDASAIEQGPIRGRALDHCIAHIREGCRPLRWNRRLLGGWWGCRTRERSERAPALPSGLQDGR